MEYLLKKYVFFRLICRLFLLFIIINPAKIFALELYVNSSLALSPSEDRLSEEKFSTEKWNLGLKVKESFGDFSFGLKNDDYNFGLSLTNQKLTKVFPFYIKCGNLSTGGILSKMNSPTLSASASPFSASLSSAGLLSASLPASTNFSKPVSFFLQGGLKKKPLFVNVNGWYSPDEAKLATSFCGQVDFQKKGSFSLAAAGGFFPHKELSESSWFLSQPYFPAGTLFSSALELSLSLPQFKSFLLAGFTENPFGNLTSFYRGEGKINCGNFIFSGAFFYTDDKNANLTASGKELSPQLQYRALLQYKGCLKTGHFPLFFKNGISLYNGLKLSENEADNHSLKVALGSQFLFPFMMLQFTLSGNFTEALLLSLQSDFPQTIFAPPPDVKLSLEGETIQIKNVWYLGSFSPSFTGSLSTSFSDFITDTYRLAFSITYSGKKKLRLSGNSSLSFTLKNGDFSKGKSAASISAAFSWKKIKCTTKLAFNFDF